MVDTAWPEAALGDFKAAAFTQQNVGSRYAYVLVFDFGMTVGRMVVPEYVQVTHDGDAGGVQRDQDHALLQVLGRVGVCLAHDDGDLAAVGHGSGGPPLGAVDHVLVAFAADFALDVGGVGGCNVGLGHGEAGADLAGQQGLQPLFLMFFTAVALDCFHIAGIRRAAVEDLRSDGGAAHDFAEVAVLLVVQTGAALAVR